MSKTETELPDRRDLRQLPHLVVDFDRPLGAGNERRLLDHPKDASRAVKVYDERRLELNAVTFRGYLTRNILSVRNRRQRRELECYLDLHLRGLTAASDLPIARILGFRQTNHGAALEVEKIRRSAENDQVGHTLRWLLHHAKHRGKVPAALNDLMDRLERFGIFVSDANYENIMMSEAGSRAELVMVDGFGDYRTLRWFPHAPWMVRRSIIKAFRSQATFWDLAWDQRSGRFVTNLP